MLFSMFVSKDFPGLVCLKQTDWNVPGINVLTSFQNVDIHFDVLLYGFFLENRRSPVLHPDLISSLTNFPFQNVFSTHFSNSFFSLLFQTNLFKAKDAQLITERIRLQIGARICFAPRFRSRDNSINTILSSSETLIFFLTNFDIIFVCVCWTEMTLCAAFIVTVPCLAVDPKTGRIFYQFATVCVGLDHPPSPESPALCWGHISVTWSRIHF